MACAVITCNVCGSSNISVNNTRYTNDGIRRRRRCGNCNNRWSTIEINVSEWQLLTSEADPVQPLPASLDEATYELHELELARAEMLSRLKALNAAAEHRAQELDSMIVRLTAGTAKAAE